jgi:uncharacterized membrane protein YjfL (UPF0719 family)
LSAASFVSGLIVAVVQLFLGMVFSITAIYSGLSLVDRLTRDIDEWALIKKGNTAAGVLFALVVLSLIIMMEPSIESTVASVHGAVFKGAILGFAVNLLLLVVAFLVSVLSIYTILRVIDAITADVSEFAEIKKGNVAVALVTGASLLAASLAVRVAILYVLAALTSAI